jgi:hypothetical protein
MITNMARRCPNCGKEYTVQVELSKFNRWQAGEHIQNVWPEKTADEREQMITGICSDECWRNYLGPEE